MCGDDERFIFVLALGSHNSISRSFCNLNFIGAFMPFVLYFSVIIVGGVIFFVFSSLTIGDRQLQQQP